MTFRVGIALSSGGAAGLAHIGVIEELLRAGIEISCVAGTSAGAMVGGVFAAGGLDDFRDHMLGWARRRRLTLFDPIWPRIGLLGGRRTMQMLGSCASQRIEEMARRFTAVATDLDSGQRVTLSSGELGAAIRASISIPGVLAPVCRDGRLLVDGALVDPVPVGPARELGATFVIASSVIGSAGTALRTRCFAKPLASLPSRVLARVRNSAGLLSFARSDAVPAALAVAAAASTAEPTDGLSAVLYKASAVVQTTIAGARLRDEPPDFLIAPAAYEIGLFDVHRAAHAIEIGRAATRAALPDLLAALDDAQANARASSKWWGARESAAA